MVKCLIQPTSKYLNYCFKTYSKNNNWVLFAIINRYNSWAAKTMKTFGRLICSYCGRPEFCKPLGIAHNLKRLLSNWSIITSMHSKSLFRATLWLSHSLNKCNNKTFQYFSSVQSWKVVLSMVCLLNCSPRSLNTARHRSSVSSLA